jgi:chemotaxis protein MotB
MADDTQRPIVIKRIKKVAGGHHGGAWKIAYADFVTAMMAFFLLMWLLGSTTKGDLKGISDYFQTPLKVALSGGSGSGNSSSPLAQGGRDLTRTDSLQMKQGTLPERKATVTPKEAQAEVQRQEGIRLNALKTHIEQVIEASALMRQYREQLLIDITSEGLRVQIVDQLNRPMFDLGSAKLKPHAREILLGLSAPLNEVQNSLSLTGHTDAKPYSSGERGYSNWELSADRANASRRVLVEGGIAEGKIKRVVGMASAVLFDGKDPFNPINRRIALIVLTRDAEESLNRVSGATVARAAEAAPATEPPAAAPAAGAGNAGKP